MKESCKEEAFYKVWDLERELSVSRATIYRWCKKRVIEYVKLPSGHIRIPREEVEKLKQRAK
jgi:excisionase family DNA binding protein